MPPPLVVMILLPLNENTPIVPKAPGGPTAIGGAERLGRVVDDGHAVPRARLEDRVAVGALAVEVDTDERGRQPPGAGPLGELVVDERGVQVPRELVAVDEHRTRARIQHRVRGRHEGERRHDHVVTRADTEHARARGAARPCRSTAPRPPGRRRSSANSRSNASTCGPSGAIQLESNASSSS